MTTGSGRNVALPERLFAPGAAPPPPIGLWRSSSATLQQEMDMREIERRDSGLLVTRRVVLASGAGVGVIGMAGCQTATGINPLVPPAAKVIQDQKQVQALTADQKPPGYPTVQAVDPIDKPTYVAESFDPVAYSRADNLFWNDIMMEHALFFVQLMPGPDLEPIRRQAVAFNQEFAQRFEQSRAIDAGNYVAFNRGTMDLARRFSEYKKTVRDQQNAGRWHTLVFPLFFTHTAREADRFAARLAMYNGGNIEFERAEVVDFWSKTMSEHSAFIAHLLDPTEGLLIDQAVKLENAFARPSAIRRAGADPIMAAAQEVLDFKTVGEKGIRSGMIKSIIRPELAAHVRREAVRFIDELKRARA
jgi:hypothetical protein